MFCFSLVTPVTPLALTTVGLRLVQMFIVILRQRSSVVIVLSPASHPSASVSFPE